MVTGQLAPKKNYKLSESTRPQVNLHPSNFISTLDGFYGASYISLAHKFYDLNNLSCLYLVIFSSDWEDYFIIWF